MAGYRAAVESGESQDQDPGSTGRVTSDGARALQRTGKRKSPPMDMAAVAGSTPVIAFGDPTITRGAAGNPAEASGVQVV